MNQIGRFAKQEKNTKNFAKSKAKNNGLQMLTIWTMIKQKRVNKEYKHYGAFSEKWLFHE